MTLFQPIRLGEEQSPRSPHTGSTRDLHPHADVFILRPVDPPGSQQISVASPLASALMRQPVRTPDVCTMCASRSLLLSGVVSRLEYTLDPSK